TNEVIAVNSQGVLGLVYQEFVNPNWETHFRTFDATNNTWSDTTLCKSKQNGFMGDYCGLLGIGKDFYGSFAADNTPMPQHFPTVQPTYLRNAVFSNTNPVLKDNAGNVINSSIDPFFFKATMLDPDRDFYVRDWTDTSLGTHDEGQEPSTNPIFYETSDVWNKQNSQ